MSDPDPATTYERLKIETAEMLNLNVASSSLLENLQVDLVALLRLEIDTLQGAVLAGESVDLNRLSTALTMLRTLLPAQALVAPAPAPESRFGPSARERLRALIERTVLTPPVDDPGELERKAELMRREEMAAVIAAGGSVEAPAPPPEPTPTNVVPIDANSRMPPAHYLKDGQREAWRDHFDGRATGPHPWPLPR